MDEEFKTEADVDVRLDRIEKVLLDVVEMLKGLNQAYGAEDLGPPDGYLRRKWKHRQEQRYARRRRG